ncbi:MAG: HlyD family type I secretion periplasmic adaptor subunit [Solirubrobacterales bacterium]
MSINQSAQGDEAYYHVGPVARIGFALIFGFLLLLTIWSLVADLSGAVVASGVVIPEGKRKTVQHISGGTVAQLLVTEGQRVLAGQPLIKLDEYAIRSNYEVLRSQYYSTLAQEARLIAEQQDLTEIPSLLPDDPYAQEFMRQEQRLFVTRRAAYTSQINVLKDRIQQLHEEIGGHQKLRSASEQQLALLKEELEGIRELASKGYAPKVKLLQYDRSIASLQGDIGFRTSEISKARQKIAETESEKIQVQRRLADDTSRELRDVQVKRTDLEPRLAAAKEALNQTVITSPIDGQVMNLVIVTVGGVVEPGKPVMDIVPVGGGVLVEAQASPQDIEELRPGLAAQLHVSTHGGNNVPNLTGEVATVSGDRIVEPRTGQPYYAIQVRIPEAEVEKIAPMRLIPGMGMEVVIPIKERTLFDYLVSPLKQRMRKALREP